MAGRIQGHTDTDLCPQGREEAKKLAASLLGFNIHLIVCSDLKRAAQTAEIINTFLKVPLRFDKRLRECSFGLIEGLAKAEVMQKFGLAAKIQYEDDHYDFRLYGGEDHNSVLTRHLEVVNDLTAEFSGKNILLVGHGRGLLTLLAEFGQIPLQRGEYRVIEKLSC